MEENSTLDGSVTRSQHTSPVEDPSEARTFWASIGLFGTDRWWMHIHLRDGRHCVATERLEGDRGAENASVSADETLARLGYRRASAWQHGSTEGLVAWVDVAWESISW
jgi:hypothetical protein